MLVELGPLVLLEIINRREEEGHFFLTGIFSHQLDDGIQVGDCLFIVWLWELSCPRYMECVGM